MPTSRLLLLALAFSAGTAGAQSTFVNAVIPGDHPDPTLTRIGDDYYTSGSSFNVTPKIYHSTDLVHWEVIAQPVSAAWDLYDDRPAGGVWGGHTVFRDGQYWHFFGLDPNGRQMYFVTADQVEGPWSEPTRMVVPSGERGFGVDNSIFIDDDADESWYLLTKNGEAYNYLVELGDDGQATGTLLDLSWLNPEPDLPYGWAEGPVMWKHDGYYYYSFAQHLVGTQYVMKSSVQGAPLSDDPGAWDTPRVLFEGPQGPYNAPNHSSPAVTTVNGTSWVISQSYDRSNGGEWQALGRQGVLSQLVYDAEGWPKAQFPNGAEAAPDLPSSGIPWTVPRSDTFDGTELAPDWSFLGFTPDDTHSLTARPGWLRLTPSGGRTFPTQTPGQNTVIQNAAERAFSLVTRVDFDAVDSGDEAGLWTFNGPESIEARVFVSADVGEVPVVVSYFDDAYTGIAELDFDGPVWLRLHREGHDITSSYSADGQTWVDLSTVDVSPLDRDHPQAESGYDFNAFTGNQQGPYVRGDVPADFDVYIYRDGYAPIAAAYPSNYNGVAGSTSASNRYLGGIGDGDWAMYAGVELGRASDGGGDVDYPFAPRAVELVASSATDGGTVEVWLDGIDTGEKIADVEVPSTGAWTSYATVTAEIEPVSGQRDVFLRFSGTSGGELLRLQSLRFAREIQTAAGDTSPLVPSLDQNYPNPIAAGQTTIAYTLESASDVTLTVFNVLGQEVATLVDGARSAGRHEVPFDTRELSSGVYLYRLTAGTQTEERRMTVVR